MAHVRRGSNGRSAELVGVAQRVVRCGEGGGESRRCQIAESPSAGAANVLNKVARSVQVNMKADLREIYGAPTRAAAEAAIDMFADKYGVKYDKAVACLTKDREALLAFFDFPAEHWNHFEPDRERVCHRPSSNRADERIAVAKDRQGHGL
jgi:hypothetical protein